MTNPFPHRQSRPDLAAERSLSLESELNTVVLAGVRRLRYVALRVGYQHTLLDDLIVFGPTGVPENANRRILSSVEARGDVAIAGGHRLSLGYAFLRGEDLETGPLRHIPQHRLHLDLEARLRRGLDAHLSVVTTGPVEDLNRVAVPAVDGSATAWPGVVVVNRLPATANVDLGVVASGLAGGRLDVAAHVVNALDSRSPIADPDFDSREAIYSTTAPGLSARLSLTWRM